MRHKMLKAYAFLITCIITISSFAQTANYQSRKIAPALLRQDFLLLRDTLQKMHPGLYVYMNKTTIDNMFDSCFSAIKDSMTVSIFMRLQVLLLLLSEMDIPIVDYQTSL
jgi:hypothetical protein